MNRLQRLCAATATLLATAAQAAVLTLPQPALNAQPGDTAGWGFTLLNDDAALYLLVTGSEFAPAPGSAFGSYADLLASRADMVVLAPLASLSEAYDATLPAGIGQFSFAATASGLLDGQVQLHYALFSVDPRSPAFDPDLHLVTADATALAQASLQAVPEPASWLLFGAAGALAVARRVRPRRSA